MAINPIALYSDPVKYKEVLEKSSHLFDDMKPFFVTVIEQDLNSHKDDFAQINAAIGPDYSFKDNGYLDTWYGYDPDDPEYAIEIRDEIDKRIHQAEQSLSTIHWMFDVYYPTLGVYAAIQQMWAYEEEAPAIETPYQLTAEEVYDQLTKANELIADKLIRRISCPMYARKQLLDAYKTHDKGTFISVLEDPANNCDCTEIYKYANTRSAARAEEVINFALFFKELNHYLYGEVEALQDLKDEIQSAKDGDHLRTVTLSLFVNRSFTDISEYLNNIEISLHNRIIQKLELANTYPATESQINVYEMITNKSIYYEVFNKYSKFNDIERGVLDSILKRPAGLELYNKYKAEYEKERFEEQPEEQQVQQQMDAPSEDAIPQNDSPQEDTGLQERTHKACDFSKYDGLFDTRGDLPNKDEYLEVLNAKFKKDGVWPVLLAFLYQHGYLSLPDIPRFVYRMTGKRVGNFSLITKIEWKNHPKDLHYLCTALHGSVPINNMKAFFDFGKDDKRFHGKYDPTSEMKSFLKINFEYTKKKKTKE